MLNWSKKIEQQSSLQTEESVQLLTLQDSIHKEKKETTELFNNLWGKIDSQQQKGNIVLEKGDKKYELRVNWRWPARIFVNVEKNKETIKSYYIMRKEDGSIVMCDTLNDEDEIEEQKLSLTELKDFAKEVESLLQQYTAEQEKSKKKPSIFN